jgi:DME family drug/metabolite transporter
MHERTTAMAAPAARRPGSGLFFLIVSGLLWGTGGLTGSLLSRATGLSAISVAAYRLTVGGLLIVGFLTVTGRRWPAGRAAWTRIAVIGALAAQYQSCYFSAVALTSVPLATLVTIGTAPVIVLGAGRLTGRPAGRFAAATTALALTGLGLLVGLPSGFSRAAVLASAGMAVLAAGGFAAITLAGARPVPGLDDLTMTGFGFTIGGLALMPLAQTVGGVGFTPGPAAVSLLAVLGTGPTAVAYTLYFRGLRTATASTGALLALLEPLTGAVLAALILGERLSPAGIAGAVLIASALVLTVRANGGGRRGGPEQGAGRVGGHDGRDAQPGGHRQRLAQDHQADDRGQDRVHAHEDAEVVRRDPAQREQVGQERPGRGQHPGCGGAPPCGRCRRMPDQVSQPSRHEDQGGQGGRRGRALRPRDPLPDQAVGQDVAGPAGGG